MMPSINVEPRAITGTLTGHPESPCVFLDQKSRIHSIRSWQLSFPRQRLSMTRNGRVRYELKTPWRNGTTHVIFEPLDFISRLVSLVPKPRINLTRFYGVFAPNSKYRAKVVPAKRGKRKKCHSVDGTDQTPAEKRASMAGFCSCKTGIHAIPGNSRFFLLQNRHTCHPWQ